MPETATTDSLKLQNVHIDDLLTMGADAPIDLDEHSSAPSAPESGLVRLYAKADGKLYIKDSGAVETALDAATGGAVMKSAFDAYSVLAADSDDTPVALSVGTSQLVGRKATGGMAALAAADVLELLASVLSFPLKASSWYDGAFPFGVANVSGSLFLTADRIYAVPFWAPHRTEWDEIGIYVAGADAGKKIKLGIYDVASNAEPGNLVFGSAELSMDSAGTVNDAGLSETLDPGLYFLALRSDSGAGQVTTVQRGDATGRFIPAAALNISGGTYYYSDTGSYAADGLPATYPSSPSISTAASAPRVMLKTSGTL